MKSAKKILLTVLVLLNAGFIFAGGKKDNNSQQVNKSQQLHRIVCLSPSGAEILCAVGAEDQIVARTDFCDYPQSLSSIKSVGGFDGKTLSIETIIACNPDFVYGSKGMHDFLKDSLEGAGITLYLSQSTSISDVLDEIQYIADFTGNSDNGKKVVDEINSAIKTVELKNSSAKKSNPKTVYYEVWNAPFMSVGNTSFINELIQCAGGKNIFDDLASDYPVVSEETIIARSPDVIIIPDMNGTTLENVESRNGWKNINAVKNNNIFFVDANIFTRPGPRIAEAIVFLAKIMNQDDNSTSEEMLIDEQQ